MPAFLHQDTSRRSWWNTMKMSSKKEKMFTWCQTTGPPPSMHHTGRQNTTTASSCLPAHQPHPERLCGFRQRSPTDTNVVHRLILREVVDVAVFLTLLASIVRRVQELACWADGVLQWKAHKRESVVKVVPESKTLKSQEVPCVLQKRVELWWFRWIPLGVRSSGVRCVRARLAHFWWN